MSLDLRGFVTEEQDFKGLYQAGNTLERREYRNQQLTEQRNAKRAASAKFLESWLDPKDSLSGSPYDPNIVKGYHNLLTKGAALANQGADNNMLIMALGKDVQKLAEYGQKAKIVNARLKQQLGQVKHKGYNLSALEQEARKTAFYNPDGSLKDIAEVDPSQDYLTETIRLYPDKVTTDAGLDEFIKNAPKFTEDKDLTYYSETGTMNKRKKKVTATPWLRQDVDEQGRPVEGLVPDFELALEDGKPQTYDFPDGKGGKKTAAVRMLNEKWFDSIMSGNPDVADYIRGQVKAHLPEGTSMDSLQAKNFARTILYDELKRRKAGSISDVQVVDKPSQMDFKINFPNQYYKQSSGKGGGSGDGDVNINDVYGEIERKRNENAAKGFKGTRMNSLSSAAQTLLISQAKNLRPDLEIGNNNVYIKDNKEGQMALFRVVDEKKGPTNIDEEIMPLDFKSVNIKVQPGVKEKREVVEQGNAAPPKSNFKALPKTGKF
jgi:hypothetical protein